MIWSDRIWIRPTTVNAQPITSGTPTPIVYAWGKSGTSSVASTLNGVLGLVGGISST